MQRCDIFAYFLRKCNIYIWSRSDSYRTALEGLHTLSFQQDILLMGILGQVWYLIVSIPDHCPLTNFQYIKNLHSFRMDDIFFFFKLK